jgi:hypothetical protein
MKTLSNVSYSARMGKFDDIKSEVWKWQNINLIIWFEKDVGHTYERLAWPYPSMFESIWTLKWKDFFCRPTFFRLNKHKLGFYTIVIQLMFFILSIMLIGNTFHHENLTWQVKVNYKSIYLKQIIQLMLNLIFRAVLDFKGHDAFQRHF